MRNILAHVGQKEKAAFAARLKQIWLQPSRETALQLANLVSAEYEERFPKAIEVLQKGLEDSLQFYGLSELEAKKIASTNMRERLHREIRRRSRVVDFPRLHPSRNDRTLSSKTEAGSMRNQGVCVGLPTLRMRTELDTIIRPRPAKPESRVNLTVFIAINSL